MAKKTEPGKVVCSPFMNLTYLKEGERVRIKTMHVMAGPVDPGRII